MFFILVFIGDQAISLITENKPFRLAVLDVIWTNGTGKLGKRKHLTTKSAAKLRAERSTYEY